MAVDSYGISGKSGEALRWSSYFFAFQIGYSFAYGKTNPKSPLLLVNVVASWNIDYFKYETNLFVYFQ